MRYYVNGKRTILNEGDSLMVNARQMHYGYACEQQDCYFACILFHPSLFVNNQVLYDQYFAPVLENSSLEYLLLHASDKTGRTVSEKLLEIVHFA